MENIPGESEKLVSSGNENDDHSYTGIMEKRKALSNQKEQVVSKNFWLFQRY